MAKFNIGRGLDDFIALLGDLEFEARGQMGRAIFVGAAVVADEIHKNIEALPVQTKSAKKGKKRNPTQVEIDGMLQGLGVAKMQDDNGFWNVKIGMDGYNAHRTEQYPNGHPNAMVARTIESGNSYMNKIPFISRAVSRTRAKSEEEMKKQFEELVEKTVKKHGG